MRQNNIVLEQGPFWIKQEGPGHFTLWENVGTHSVRRGTSHFSNDPAKAWTYIERELQRRIKPF